MKQIQEGKSTNLKYAVKIIILSERPSWYSCDQEFMEYELTEMTANGEEAVAILRDHEDLLVVLKMPAQGGVG